MVKSKVIYFWLYKQLKSINFVITNEQLLIKGKKKFVKFIESLVEILKMY